MRAHETQIRVRYQETDNMGVVYYANYFVWFEVARTEYFRSMGVSYSDLENKGFYMMVASASCQYKAPAKYDDIITVKTWISDSKATSMKFKYEILNEEKLLAAGESVHVFTNRSRKPTRIPEEVRKHL